MALTLPSGTSSTTSLKFVEYKYSAKKQRRAKVKLPVKLPASKVNKDNNATPNRRRSILLDTSDSTDLKDSDQVPRYERSASGFKEYANLRMVYCEPSISRSSMFPVQGTHDASYAVEYCMLILVLSANQVDEQLI